MKCQTEDIFGVIKSLKCEVGSSDSCCRPRLNRKIPQKQSNVNIPVYFVALCSWSHSKPAPSLSWAPQLGSILEIRLSYLCSPRKTALLLPPTALREGWVWEQGRNIRKDCKVPGKFQLWTGILKHAPAPDSSCFTDPFHTSAFGEYLPAGTECLS